MSSREEVLQKMRLALDLSEDAERIARQNLERRHPSEPPGRIAERLAAWLRTRPGAGDGDGVGRVVDRFGLVP